MEQGSKNFWDLLRDGFSRAADFTQKKTKWAKIKYHIHTLEQQRDHLLEQSGEKLWQLSKEKSKKNLENVFAEEFEKMAELNRNIEIARAEAKKL